MTANIHDPLHPELLSQISSTSVRLQLKHPLLLTLQLPLLPTEIKGASKKLKTASAI
jgi:hypothetical protein